ncbi:TOTE conflict system archaeo-eukaryotic primase domain-containing protein [Bhargavaea beijingensis]|uniref:TOTE conflict system primase domain-containing protein n=1 Tax=Bhargavaea beijingensis TaxID=426756 RepID=A0ABX9ZG23_9BACL|nr:hypothetical protein [Bhargavaea beijingensis]RSK36612.1 hypothetical protein EJA12_02370 [Bhargavaea beijingensis]
MNDELQLIIKKMNNLFITERKKYITQNEDGNGYNWWEIGKKRNFKKLQDYMLEYHLRGKRTYGIFSGPEVSKFITFDVDMVSNELVLSLYKELNQIGISSKYIHTSWSGSKGYHVDIYFSDVIHVSRVKRLFDYMEFRLKRNFPNFDIERILEFRPSPTQGVKLPLGVNLANKDPNSNICWYVDVKDGLKPIRTLEYILNIEPIKRDDLIRIINALPETIVETIEFIAEDSNEQSPLNDHELQI